MGPTGNIEKIRDEDEQHYVSLGYKHIVEPETIELMSPAGRVVVSVKDAEDCLQRDGWSYLEEGSIRDCDAEAVELEVSAEPEVPEPEVLENDDTEAAEQQEPEILEDEPEISEEDEVNDAQLDQ